MIDLKTRCIALYLFFFTVGFGLGPVTVSAQAPAAEQRLRDGQHDFDFHIGTWHEHIRFIAQPLTGSNTWVEREGAVTVRKIWDGHANLEELVAGNPSAPFKGMTLLLYNPQAHQWSQSFASIKEGTLNTPLIGEFKNGRGDFYGQEKFNGRTILVRFVWSDITADSYHMEQSYSDDGGKTWEPNFIANLTREKK
jgi:hypothetical protein